MLITLAVKMDACIQRGRKPRYRPASPSVTKRLRAVVRRGGASLPLKSWVLHTQAAKTKSVGLPVA